MTFTILNIDLLQRTSLLNQNLNEIQQNSNNLYSPTELAKLQKIIATYLDQYDKVTITNRQLNSSKTNGYFVLCITPNNISITTYTSVKKSTYSFSLPNNHLTFNNNKVGKDSLSHFLNKLSHILNSSDFQSYEIIPTTRDSQ
tara:strand:- start:684 stop:1112 length:429 start_codon:yes stop_codon:yes gene_type:complete